MRVITIGRAEDVDVQVASGQTQVSRYQARVYVMPHGLEIEDFNAVQGKVGNVTSVNGRPVTHRAPFRLTDEVMFGSYRFNTAELQRYLNGGRGAGPALLPRAHNGGGAAPGPLRAPQMAPPPAAMAAAPAAQPSPVVVHIHQGSPGAENYRGSGPVAGTIRSPILVVLFSIFTLGIYTFVWQWMVLDEMKPWRGHQGMGGASVLILFVPFVGWVYAIALWFLLPAYVGEMYARDGRSRPVTGVYGFLIFVPIFGLIICLVLIQNALNEFWRTKLPA